MKKLMLVLLAISIANSHAQSSLSEDINSEKIAQQCTHGSKTNSPLAEEKFISIGGIQQWVSIKGQNCDNPVILFLHGGPGNPESIYADSMYGEWEKTFTIVHWDQRGAGKTYGQNSEPDALNINLMVEDGLDVAKYLTSYLNKKKVILVGSSWGAILGVYMSHKNPALFYAYVSTSQAGLDVDGIESYKKTLAFAKKTNDLNAISAIESLATPPWTNPRNFGKIRRIQRALEAKVTEAQSDTWVISPTYSSDEYSEIYTAGEDFSYIQFIGLNGDGFSTEIDLSSLGYDFQIPIYFVQGEEDLLTVAELSRRYFDKISAPDKAYLLLPKVGHGPNKRSLDANFQILIDKVLPLTQ